MEFSERNKGWAAFAAGTARVKERQFRAAEDGIGRKTVSLSERAAEGQRKGEYGCRRAFPSGSGFGRTYCRRFVFCQTMHGRRLLRKQKQRSHEFFRGYADFIYLGHFIKHDCVLRNLRL